MATLSAPESTTEVPILLDLSGSSGFSPLETPSKKQKATPAQCALVATSQNVTLHNARQITNESDSFVQSVVSSAERQRRYAADLALFELAEQRVQLAEARVALIKSRDQLSAGSQTGSVGRLEDVDSSSGVSLKTQLPTENAILPSQDGVSAPLGAFGSADDPIRLLLWRSRFRIAFGHFLYAPVASALVQPG